MSIQWIVTGASALGILVYLLYSLLWPERF